jgi:hypothetical protein
VEATATAQATVVCSHHDDDGDGDAGEHDGRHNQPCEEDDCISLVSSPVKLPRCETTVFSQPLVAPLNPATAVISAPQSGRFADSHTSAAAPTLRLHVWTHVWLL